MNEDQWTFIAILASFIFAGLIIWKLQKYRKTNSYSSRQDIFHKFLRLEKKIIDSLIRFRKRIIRRDWSTFIQSEHLVEVLIIGAWAFWVGLPYLNLAPQMWPTGREFGIQVAYHNFWNQVKECGFCALWNGSINGGAPALGDPFSSTFHPYVMIFTLLFGIVNGVKIATIFSLWTAGISQWIIAYSFGARRTVRLWSSAIFIVGGHLLGRMELGAFGILLSTTMASLVFASMIFFIKGSTKKSISLLIFSIALTMLSGHGYNQVGILLSVPIFFLIGLGTNKQQTKRQFLISILLGILITSVIIIPIIHFTPQIEKWSDLEGELSQDLQYIPLNLVIHDWNYYTSESLNKAPYPYLTNIYIGWIPVLLALLSFLFPKKEYQSIYYSSLVSIFLFLFLASGIPFRWTSRIIPFVSGIRHTQLIAGLMLAPIIGMASYSLEKIFAFDWAFLKLSHPTGKDIIVVSTKWLLIIPLIFSLQKTYNFNKAFIEVKNLDDVYQGLTEVELKRDEWFAPPFGEHWWVLASLENDLKITGIVTPWWWKGNEQPEPKLLMAYSNPPEGLIPHSTINEIPSYQNQDYSYASVISSEMHFPCQAEPNGGMISVSCNQKSSGQLHLQERSWSGWRVWRDGSKVPLKNSAWLTVNAPSGKHRYTFRYLPWDVMLGSLLSISALIISYFYIQSSFPKDTDD